MVFIDQQKIGFVDMLFILISAGFMLTSHIIRDHHKNIMLKCIRGSLVNIFRERER